MTTIVWFRQDLRTRDNPALQTAMETGLPVIPVYLWSPEEEGSWAPGSASRWWLHHSLIALQHDLDKLGLRLILRKGKSLEQLQKLVTETGAKQLFWNRRYEPLIIQRDTHIKATLQEAGLNLRSFNSALLFEPWTIVNKKGKPFQVFTPFWKSCLSQDEPPLPTPQPAPLQRTAPHIPSLKVAELDLLPHIPWDEGLRDTWKPGEKGAQHILENFLEHVQHYSETRDRPDLQGVSRLSPHLHFGEISPRTIWHAVKQQTGGESYLRQLGWREFAHHLLFHFPHTIEKPLHPKFEAFPWNENHELLKAWQKGLTGYPIVDAGMRELWHTGWMHNRVRMIVGSFLVKDLLLPWLDGAKWFWDTLVDANLANNTLGWQWVAGCGADAAPYYRIFNPVLQGEKFDPEGLYVRKWIPELQDVPLKWLHKPWETTISHYPKPIVNHEEARQRALRALQTMKEQHE